MTDEKFTFVTDVADKKRTARGAHNKRTHAGKSGRVRFPSDNLTKKELNALNGEVKSYRMNDPMTWEQFMSMPDDLKRTYIMAIRNKYNPPDSRIFEMLGICQQTGSRHFKALNLARGKDFKRGKFDADGWFAWVTGETVNEVEVVEPTENESDFHEPEVKVLLSLNDREIVIRELGRIEGLACGICNTLIYENLRSAVDTIMNVLNKESYETSNNN